MVISLFEWPQLFGYVANRNIYSYNLCIFFIFQSSPNVLVDRKPAKEIKKFKPKIKDSPSDIETCSVADSPGLMVNSFDSSDVYVGDVSDMISPVELNDVNGSAANGIETDIDCAHVRNGVVESIKSDGPSPCIVCNKIFKSKSCLNKHLRNVHTGWF